MKNIKSMDLNLLKALDALLDERNVTRAAARLGLTQPALSGMLTRLRESFGDPLFARSQRGTASSAAGAASRDACQAGARRNRRAAPATFLQSGHRTTDLLHRRDGRCRCCCPIPSALNGTRTACTSLISASRERAATEPA